MIAGRYSLEREIGRGGMGAVWLGRDEVLERQVALKRIGLLPGADSTDLARAEREAHLAARLSHPHLVAVFDFVHDADTDSRWLVMEYVDGITLAQLIRSEGPLPPPEAGPVLQQAADALVAAHGAGIVHRDVKPSNILVDRMRRVKLTDFGIARTADSSLTQTGMVTGSPAYLAPEVAGGERGDESVDVWSLGATAYHLLSGRPPYDIGDNVIGGLYRIVHEDPPRLPEAGWLAPMLEGTMVKDPAGRWSMEQVRDYLADPRAAVEATPTVAAPAATVAGTAANGDDATQTLSQDPAPAEQVPLDEPVAAPEPAEPDASRSRGRGVLVTLVAVVAALVLGWLLLTNLLGGDDQEPTDTTQDTPSASPSQSPSPTETSPTDEPSPTADGMESFIRDYVTAISVDPTQAFEMLTPKFQRESGGLETYREFWSDVGDGRILEINADPETLVVRYRVAFENFGTGERPTVLDLVFEDGRYLIDGERTQGA